MRYVVDTHALWWYLNSSARLSSVASNVFRMAASGEATIIVPAIVIAEFYFLSVKFGRSVSPAEFIDTVTAIPGFEFSELGRPQLEQLDLLQEVPEMHDRLIAAESMILDAPVITRDGTLSDSSQVETLW